MAMKSLVATVLLLLGSSNAFYIPGVAPQTFQKGESVELKVNSMTSVHTQLPKDYYRLPFCRPDGGPKMASENLGEFITGNKIQSSPYSIQMLTEVNCRKVCQVKLNPIQASKLNLHIKYGYHHNWIIDNLPSAHIGDLNGRHQKHYAGGFPMGFIESESKQSYVYNHVNIILDYHPRDEGYRVVGFAVEPLSIKHTFQGGYDWDGKASEGFEKQLDTCPEGKHVEGDNIRTFQKVASGENIVYTYDVTWRESEVAWSSRWDVYLNEDHQVPAQVHWYAITNSVCVVIFLSLLLLSVLLRNLRRDIEGYNALATLTDEENGEEIDDETGWKLVHADVFRPPDNLPMMFCVFIGSGVQIAVTILAAICFSAVGFLSPARRGSLVNALLVLYMLFGVCAGYVSSRLYKSFGGKKWQLCTVITAILFPGIAFLLFLIFNIVLYFLQSSASAPVLDVIILAAMWCCVSVPLVFFGAYFGYKQDTMEFPTETSKYERPIPPPTSIVVHPLFVMIFACMIPFAAAYVELFFIMTSLWMDQFYYVFGFTLIVYLILIITCAEVAVLAVYYQLCSENHRWWWLSFFCSGGTAFFTFIYSVFWFKALKASNMIITYLLYFGYMSLISFMMMLVLGSIGSLTSLWFVRKIFGAIKVD